MNENNTTPGSSFSSFQKERRHLLYIFYYMQKKIPVLVPNTLTFLGINHLWLSPMSANRWEKDLLIMKPVRPDTCLLKYPEAIISQFPEIKEMYFFFNCS